jgi:Sensors of blue-light using FAD
MALHHNNRDTVFMQVSSFEPASAAANSGFPLGEVAPTDQLAYCCLASPGVLALGMEEWIESFHSPDHEPQVSGLLIWEGRLMIHWLEGPRHLLDVLWTQIQNDPRQHCLVLLKHEPGIKKRWFANWQMQPTSRNEMMTIVREARDQAHLAGAKQQEALQHAIGTLSILLNPELTPIYAQFANPANAWIQTLQPIAQAKRA